MAQFGRVGGRGGGGGGGGSGGGGGGGSAATPSFEQPKNRRQPFTQGRGRGLVWQSRYFTGGFEMGSEADKVSRSSNDTPPGFGALHVEGKSRGVGSVVVVVVVIVGGHWSNYPDGVDLFELPGSHFFYLQLAEGAARAER